MPADNVISESRRLLKLAESNLRALIKTEITLSFTFCGLAESRTRHRDIEHARISLRNAKAVAEFIRQYFSQARFSGSQRDEVLRQLDAIERRVSSLTRVLHQR
jgi:hypothetical protein